VRTSRADLINVARIDRFVGNGDGTLTLTLSDSTHVRVSRRRAAQIKRALDEIPRTSWSNEVIGPIRLRLT